MCSVGAFAAGLQPPAAVAGADGDLAGADGAVAGAAGVVKQLEHARSHRWSDIYRQQSSQNLGS